MPDKIKLTKHVRHARLVKLVRKVYQEENPGSKIFPNTSGMAWQGDFKIVPEGVMIKNARPIRFGIPEPRKNETDEDGSGGADLLGETMKKDFGTSYFMKGFPILTGIECKTGASKLKPNQKRFREWLKGIGGIHYTARECSCWERWEPVKKGNMIIEWIPPADCPECGGRGFMLEE